MAYVKNIWVDQDVERPKTYEVTNNEDGSITLTDSFGLVTELGTPVDEVNMNHIEDGIAGCAIRKHNLTETFELGEWVLGGSGDNEGLYKSLIANNVGNAITNTTAWEQVKMGGASGRNVGEVITSTLPLTDAGLHLLDGTLLQYGIYQEFIDYIADLYAENPTANYFTDETTWQNSVTQYGSCGKFVYDSTNQTVRLPKVSGKIDGTTDINALGDLEPLFVRLPNITGHTGQVRGYSTGSEGALYQLNVANHNYGASGSSSVSELYIDASRCSSVYSGDGSNTAIHEQAVKMFVYIVIANSTKTEIQVDIDKIVTDLNGKADTDLSNCTDVANIKMAHNAMPSNTYIDLTLGASGSRYTAPADGWFYFAKKASANGQYVYFGEMSIPYGLSGGDSMILLPCRKGDTNTLTYNLGGTTSYFRFYYAVGSESEAN